MQNKGDLTKKTKEAYTIGKFVAGQAVGVAAGIGNAVLGGVKLDPAGSQAGVDAATHYAGNIKAVLKGLQ